MPVARMGQAIRVILQSLPSSTPRPQARIHRTVEKTTPHKNFPPRCSLITPMQLRSEIKQQLGGDSGSEAELLPPVSLKVDSPLLTTKKQAAESMGRKRAKAKAPLKDYLSNIPEDSAFRLSLHRQAYLARKFGRRKLQGIVALLHQQYGSGKAKVRNAGALVASALKEKYFDWEEIHQELVSKIKLLTGILREARQREIWSSRLQRIFIACAGAVELGHLDNYAQLHDWLEKTIGIGCVLEANPRSLVPELYC